MRRHEIKTWPIFFEAVQRGRKTFEVRENDRAYAEGDMLVLREWDPDIEDYTGAVLERRVTYVLPGDQLGVEPGHVVMAIAPIHDPISASGLTHEEILVACRNVGIDLEGCAACAETFYCGSTVHPHTCPGPHPALVVETPGERTVRRIRITKPVTDLFEVDTVLVELYPSYGYVKPDHHDIEHNQIALEIALFEAHPGYWEWLEPIPFSESPFHAGLQRIWSEKVDVLRTEIATLQYRLDELRSFFPELF